jgi:hypothetical protein
MKPAPITTPEQERARQREDRTDTIVGSVYAAITVTLVVVANNATGAPVTIVTVGYVASSVALAVYLWRRWDRA